MKGELVYLLLLSLVANAYSKCQPNEVLDRQTQKCVKICKVGEVFNYEKSSCVSNITNIDCPEGQKFNNATTSCENIPKEVNPNNPDQEQEDPDYLKEEEPDYLQEKEKPVKKNNTCKGGKLTFGKCICPDGKKLKKGDCVDEPKLKKCINGILLKGKCLCKNGFKLQGDNECIPIKKCIGGLMENGNCKCPEGKSLQGDKCEGINQCIGGRIMSGVCKCPLGTQLQKGRCIPEKKCKKREYLEKGKCVPLCKQGTFYLNPKNCPPPPKSKCPPGTVRIGNSCYHVRRTTSKCRYIGKRRICI